MQWSRARIGATEVTRAEHDGKVGCKMTFLGSTLPTNYDLQDMQNLLTILCIVLLAYLQYAIIT